MKPFELLSGVEVHGLGLFFRDYSTLVFGDVHLGFEGELNRSGVLVPMFQFVVVEGRLRGLLSESSPRRVVINGDLKHEFGSITQQEWREVLMFLDLLDSYEVSLVSGNHDTILGPIAGKRNVGVVDHVLLGTTYVCHGHKIPKDGDFRKAETVVIGHDHPCVGLREEGRTEKVKCYLSGVWEDKRLIVMPSFSPISYGVDVLQEKMLSPFLQGDLGGFKAYGIEGAEVMQFGTVKDLIAGMEQ